MPAAEQQPLMEQLVKMLTEQQQIARQQAEQIAQLLANRGAAPAAGLSAIDVDIIPSLPDVTPFECCNEKSRINEWLERFKFAIECTAPKAKDLAKVKCLMNKLSENAFSEYSRSVLPATVTDFGFEVTIKKLEKLFTRPQSIFIDRYECLKAERGEEEDFRQFVNRHKKLLQDFQFDKLNKEQFNCLMLLTAMKSHSDSVLRQRILAKLTADGDKVKYDNVVEDLQLYLATLAEAKVIEEPAGSRNICAVKKGRDKSHKKRNNSSSCTSSASQSSRQSQRTCWRCGNDHSPKQCRHHKTVCRKCDVVGHMERMCAKHQAWLKKYGDNSKERKALNTVRVGGIKLVNSLNQPRGLINAMIEVNGNEINCVVDTGTEVTVLNEEAHRLIGRPKLRRCKEQAQFPDGTTGSFLGRSKAHFTIGGMTRRHPFFVSKKGTKSLLGMDIMDQFGLLDTIRKGMKGLMVVTPTSSENIRLKPKKGPNHGRQGRTPVGNSSDNDKATDSENELGGREHIGDRQGNELAPLY